VTITHRTTEQLAHACKSEVASRRFQTTTQITAVPPQLPRSPALPLLRFLDRDAEVSRTRVNLPHWRQDGRTYFVTFRLDDSLPTEAVEHIVESRRAWLHKNPEPHTSEQRNEYFRLFSEALDRKLDAGLGGCQLAEPKARELVRDALYFFDGDRYWLHDWVVMPNHVHLLLTVRPEQPLSKVLHSLKSFTSKKINALLGRSGVLWQKDSFDHIVRSEASFERFRQYIAENPQKLAANTFEAGLEVATWDDDVEAASRRFSRSARR